MPLAAFSRGDSSKIPTSITPFDDGHIYFTTDNGELYIDSVIDGEERRIRINAGMTGSISLSCTLSSALWSNKEQRVQISAIKQDLNGIVGISSNASSEQVAACMAADLSVGSYGNGYIDIVANGVLPTCDIPIVVILLGVTEPGEIGSDVDWTNIQNKPDIALKSDIGVISNSEIDAMIAGAQ